MKDKEKIVFTTEKRKVSELIPYEFNPRKLSKKQLKDLKKSFEKFDYVEICVINKDNTILAGHQRIYTMLELGWEDREIEVRVPNRQLSNEEFKEYLIRSNQNGGQFDWDLLKDCFDTKDLLAWGFEEDTLTENFEIPDFPKDEEQPDLTEQKKKELKKCPACGHEF
jgi:hypothetical protein